MKGPRLRESHSGVAMMGRARCVVYAVLMLCPLALSRLDDDFAFDNSEEFQVELTANHSEIAKTGLRRLWGVPDTSAYVGHLFRMEIPKEAFTGEVIAYKVRSEEGRGLPSWLAVDSKHGLISGVPQHQDVGAHTFAVVAHGRTHGLTATDSFTIEVKKANDKPHSKYGRCVGNENRLVLMILVDGSFHKITPRQRIRALMELASFMALDGDEFWIEPYKVDTTNTQKVIMSGSGNAHRKRSGASTAIYLNVGCGEKLWPRHKVLVAGLREQSRDGTLAHVLRLPVLGWRLAAVKHQPRKKRQAPLDDGSGAYDTYDGDDDAGDYSGYDEDDEEDDDYAPVDTRRVTELDPPAPSPLPPASPAPSPAPAPHPHRHHHGEASSDYAAPAPPHTTPATFQSESAAVSATTPSTPTAHVPTVTTPSPVPPAPTAPPEDPTTARTEATTPGRDSTNTYATEEPKIKITPYSESADASGNTLSKEQGPILPRRLPIEHSPIAIVPVMENITTSTEPDLQTVIIRASNEAQPPSSSEPTVASTEPTTAETEPPTPPPASTTSTSATSTTSTTTTTPAPVVTIPATVPTTTTQEPETTTEEVTKEDFITTTEHTSPIMGLTTETVQFAVPTPANQPPTLKHHMKKLAITAGNAFRYIIPADLFTDPEEGSNLTFTMYEADGAPLSSDSWIQFIPADREVYGLPLESHVSRWNFIVEARDSEGLYARGPLDITVQQHKSRRTVNHQFVMDLKLARNYSRPVDWQIRALEGLVNLFRYTDMDHLTVLNATQKGNECEFVWTNDTLPKDAACPLDDINKLMKIMESETEAGSPSAGLARAMSPELKVAAVRWAGLGACGRQQATRAPDTYPPVTRNQVDHLTARVGQLLVYKVPEDTFFDPEDGDTRNLALSLRYSDRSPLPAGHWLQFDARNQEFYGLPAPGDEGSVHYQLIAEDSSKKSAYDSLIVEVVKAPAIRPTVEFHMTMEYPFAQLAYSAHNKRKLLEKLAALFGQTTTDDIRVNSISDEPTTIIWYNTSLPMDRCAKREIEELRNMIIADERGGAGSALRDRVDQVFDKDIKVMSIRLIPLGLCAEQATKTQTKNVVLSSNVGGGGANARTPSAGKPGAAPPPPAPAAGSERAGAGAAAGAGSGYTEYLVTFVIPAVVIVCMILVAGVIACVLYRRRRTGKMSVGDEEERQAFRSKGIPVIFQDELEERGDTEPVHKSPVIMREEKPPLLPPTPDYRSGEDAPYRPPPPFPASRTPPRPKATPTYRKPPPYVPP